jgi:O-antigen/teichoic acid export membrane protein
MLARALGVEGRGQLAVIILAPSVLSQLGTLGVPLAVTYYVARDPLDGARLFRGLMRVIGLQAVVLCLLQTAILLLLVTADERQAVLFSIPAMGALVAQQYGLAVLQGLQRFWAFNAFRVLPLLLFVGTLAVAYTLGATSLVDTVVAWTAANVVAALPLVVIMARFADTRADVARRTSRRDAFRYGLSGVLGSSSPAEILRLDQAIIAVVISRYALGLYVVALAFTNFPRFVSQSVGIVAFPKIAAKSSPNSRTLMRHYLLLVGLVAGGFVAVLEVAVGWLIPALFGSAFASAVHAAQILLVASLLFAMRRILSDIAQGLGFPISGTVAEIVNIGVGLPLAIAGAALYGIEGAAVALTLGAACSLAVIATMISRRKAVAVGRLEVADPLDQRPISPVFLGGETK